MGAAQSASTKQDASRFRRRANDLIVYAEKLKPQLPKTPAGHNVSDILFKSSVLHGSKFPPWESEPSESEFTHKSGQNLFVYVSRSKLPTFG